MFDIATRTFLELYTMEPPATGDYWYGPWNTILTTLFPAPNYIVMPQRRLPGNSQTQMPDFVITVAKLTTPPRMRTVLIVEIKNTPHWPGSIPDLQDQISAQADAAFDNDAVSEVYWIGVVGPHWQYGIKKDDGQAVKPLIAWHHTTHDEASYNDFLCLTALIENM